MDIVWPALFSSCLRWQQEVGDIGTFPALERFLSGTRVTAWPSSSHAALLFSLVADVRFDEVPVASLRQRADGHPMVDSNSILCADPITMHAGMQDLSVEAVTLADNELEPFADLVNEHLKAHKLVFKLRDNQTGLCWGFENLDVNTVPLSIAQKDGLRATLPRGSSAAALQLLSTELQMLLFDAPFNQHRIAAGLPPVNGLWFWGAGVLPELKTSYQCLSGAKLVADFAQTSKAEYVGDNPEKILAAALAGDFENGLVELTNLDRTKDSDLHEVLSAYERDFFVPLQDIKKKNAGLDVRFFDDQQRCFTNQRRSWFSQFKKTKPLTYWMNLAQDADE